MMPDGARKPKASREDASPDREGPPDREEMIDEVLEDTFPASDPPTWDSVARTPPADESDDAHAS